LCGNARKFSPTVNTVWEGLELLPLKQDCKVSRRLTRFALNCGEHRFAIFVSNPRFRPFGAGIFQAYGVYRPMLCNVHDEIL
jgi:hypothetical protein